MVPSNRNAGLVIYIISQEQEQKYRIWSDFASQNRTLLVPLFRRRSRVQNSPKDVTISSNIDKHYHRWIAYRMASSNTLLRLRCVRAEHSRYLCARISFATARACS